MEKTSFLIYKYYLQKKNFNATLHGLNGEYMRHQKKWIVFLDRNDFLHCRIILGIVIK